MGSKNKAGNIRDRLKEQLEPIVNNIGEYLLKVKQEEGTKEMLALAEKYMPYCWPKFSSMSLSADMDRPISEEQRLVELNDMYTKKELSINFKQMTVVDNNAAKMGFFSVPPLSILAHFFCTPIARNRIYVRKKCRFARSIVLY